MGNADLWQLAASEARGTASIAGGNVTVNAHNWLCRYLTTVVRFTADEKYTADDGREMATLVGLVPGLARFFKDVITVFIFDRTAADLEVELGFEHSEEATQQTGLAR